MAEGRRFRLVVGVLLLQSVISARKWASNENQTLCLDVTNSSKNQDLKCPQNHVIYSIDINSYNVTSDSARCSTTPNNDTCSGLQPDVLTQSHMCYWRQNCAITYANKLPIVRTHNPDCIGDRPSLLRIKFLCVLEDRLQTMSDPVSNYTGDLGMIRSHKFFPWHYKERQSHKMTLQPKNSSKTVFHAFVQSIEIDLAHDLVRLRAGSKTKNLTIREGIQMDGISDGRSDGRSSVSLSMETDAGTAGGEGFVLCFYWADGSETVEKEKICDKLRKQEDKTTKKTKRGRKKGTRKKGKGNKGKDKSKKKRKRKKKKKGRRDKKGRKGRKDRKKKGRKKQTQD